MVPDICQHSQPQPVLIDGHPCGIITFGNFGAATGTKVVLHRPASEGAQSLTASAWNKITGWAVVDSDNDDAGMLSNDSIVIREAGIYAIGFSEGAAPSGSDLASLELRIYNETTSEELVYKPTSGSILDGETPVLFAQTVFEFSKGDTISGYAKPSANVDTPTPVDKSRPLFYAIKQEPFE